MYLDRIGISKSDKMKVEERIPISEKVYALGKLLDGTECHIVLDIGTSKSFMSKTYYLRCKSLHLLLKFPSKTQRIQVGNGQHVMCHSLCQ